jgi:hypothetical protein
MTIRSIGSELMLYGVMLPLTLTERNDSKSNFLSPPFRGWDIFNSKTVKMKAIKTIKVKLKYGKGGEGNINECDFDPKKHEKITDKPKEKKAK